MPRSNASCSGALVQRIGMPKIRLPSPSRTTARAPAGDWNAPLSSNTTSTVISDASERATARTSPRSNDWSPMSRNAWITVPSFRLTVKVAAFVAPASGEAPSTSSRSGADPSSVSNRTRPCSSVQATGRSVPSVIKPASSRTTAPAATSSGEGSGSTTESGSASPASSFRCSQAPYSGNGRNAPVTSVAGTPVSRSTSSGRSPGSASAQATGSNVQVSSPAPSVQQVLWLPRSSAVTRESWTS